MTFNLIPKTRHYEKINENDAAPTEYLLTKSSNLAFYRTLTCKTHHSNDIWWSNKRFGK